MKTEHEFNRYFGKQLTKLKNVEYVKASDKYHLGLSDFLLWRGATSAAVEVKFVREVPAKETTRLLPHTFSGEQITFLKRIARTGNLSWGLVAVDPVKLVYLVPPEDIPESGNWRYCEFQDCNFPSYDYAAIDEIIAHLFED